MSMALNLSRIKAERIACGKTQKEIAREMGLTRSAYAKRENGLVSIGADELEQISQVLEIPKEKMYIFFTDNVPKRERQLI